MIYKTSFTVQICLVVLRDLLQLHFASLSIGFLLRKDVLPQI